MNTPTDRRAFVRTAGAALLASIAAGCAGMVVTRVTPVNGRVRLRVADHPALANPDGALRILPDGAAAELLVLRQSDGSHTVLSSVCTHRGCTVDAHGARLVCPCHGSTYDRTGRVLVGPAERPLTQLRARLTTDGILEIDLGAQS